MATTERLPLKHDAALARQAAAAPKRRGGSMWPWYFLLLILIGAVGAGAWWLSQGKEAARPELPAEQSVPIPVTQADQVGEEDLEAAVSQEQVAANVIEAPTGVQITQGLPRAERRSSTSVVRPAIREPRGTERAIFTMGEAAEALPANLEPLARPDTRPYAGRVVQLGAFATRDQAEDSWKRITRRYPYLLTKSKMVNTVYVQGLGGGRPTRMYRLQLGTSSQAQSVVICQQLERAGHSCVVVY